MAAHAATHAAAHNESQPPPFKIAAAYITIAACIPIAVALQSCRKTEALASDAGSYVADSGARADATIPTTPALRVATLNLRCLLDDWPARLPIIVDDLARIHPDLLMVQEVCREEGGRDALLELVEALNTSASENYSYKRAETHIAWDLYHEGIALISRYPLIDAEIIDLPPGIFPRKAVIAGIATDRATAQVAATHLSFGDQASTRGTQLAAVRARLQARATQGENLLIGGDLNEKPEGRAISDTLAAGYQDTWAHIHSSSAGPTFPADGPRARIDYIFLSPGQDALRPQSAERFLTVPHNRRFGSDHLGLRVDLEP